MVRLNGGHMRVKLTRLLQEHREEERRKREKQVKKNGKVS